MKLGEVCLLTCDVPRLASFYRMLLQCGENSDNAMHQTIVAAEPMLTVMHTDSLPEAQSAAIAFTVDDVVHEHERLRAAGVTILQMPERKPWGAVNMVIQDPDGRAVYLRQLQGGAL